MLINSDWNFFFKDEFTKDYFLSLNDFIKDEYKTKTIFPKYEDIFRAFNLLSPNKVKVVIIGQDPYHGKNQANGLAFSVLSSVKIPPSLKNIYKELCEDIGCSFPENGDLKPWAEQGVLLINSVMSVEEAKAHSHKNRGWEIFTDAIIKKLSIEFSNLVFILWGGASQKKELFINEKKHLIIKSSHPSPLSSYRGFFGSQPFSKTNKYLIKHNKKTIDWCLNTEETLH